MWNKRSDDNYPPKQPAAWPPPEPVRQPQQAPPPPPAARISEPVRPAAAIGSSMTIKGEIHSREELYVDGEVEGFLDVQHCLTVGPNGKVKANIKAREVVIQGQVRGNVEVTEKIAIRKNGSLVGDIRTAGIIIDDGAYFKGSIDIVKAETARKQKPAEVGEPQAVGS